MTFDNAFAATAMRRVINRNEGGLALPNNMWVAGAKILRRPQDKEREPRKLYTDRSNADEPAHRVNPVAIALYPVIALFVATFHSKKIFRRFARSPYDYLVASRWRASRMIAKIFV
ncbi:hypothetical protein [Pelagovum pacificum]|uniref:Uncharacterized protein n=1 Tax=Pelagovum pacificum TaxID=2588711 RepID=A0A5C5G8Z2_9RHOB|nr:hypothetical protein [Pelagovum pacificum]QQA45071.1 hypothetical protein I8N54_19980 [Pelagovum pacificum]TNY30555.1 hypothetical protein FHY64_19720 [Pelagovum pacificum]